MTCDRYYCIKLRSYKKIDYLRIVIIKGRGTAVSLYARGHGKILYCAGIEHHLQHHTTSQSFNEKFAQQLAVALP